MPMTFAATGDTFITRELPDPHSQSFHEVARLIQSAQFRFTNLEVTVHDFAGFPSAVSGGTWAVARPQVLDTVKQYGFNAIAWANNHTLDYAYGGLEATAKHLNEYGFIHAGVGDHLGEAEAAKYVDTPAGRVALIAVTSTFDRTWAAGYQSRHVQGRPGINPLRFETIYQVSRERMQALLQIAAHTEINAEYEQRVREGFALPQPDGIYPFGNHLFTEGETEGAVTKAYSGDLKRISNIIANAVRQADYVVVSIHAHEMKGINKEIPADFMEESARAFIDAGAHAIIGHGPHILRGIEIYKDRPIFYSIGNFIFQNETVEKLPADFYEKYGLPIEADVADAMDLRSDGGKKGLASDPKVWHSVIPYWKMEAGNLTELKLYPIELGFGQPRYVQGWPTRTDHEGVLRALAKLSKPYGTELVIEGGAATVKL